MTLIQRKLKYLQLMEEVFNTLLFRIFTYNKKMVMKKKEELIKLLEKVISIANLNLKYEMFDFEDFSYVIGDYKVELEELED